MIFDPSRNVSYPLTANWDHRGAGAYRLKCRSIPLWSDERAWKVWLSLVRAGTPPQNRRLTLPGIPFPGGTNAQPGASQPFLRTNFLGQELAVHVLDVITSTSGDPSPSLVADPSPSLLVGFVQEANASLRAMRCTVELLEVRDDQGRIVPAWSFAPDFVSDGLLWRLRFERPNPTGTNQPAGPRSIHLTLAFPEERNFEYTVASVRDR
ncbi:MAG: hypothetical protein AB7J34_21395 [Limisphaerales bacterium]